MIINDNITEDITKGDEEIARKKREWYPKAVYHLMERGIRRQKIFEDISDYQVFTELMKTALKKNRCTVHAYCMMTNHFHLLLETDDIEIAKFMKFLANGYAIYFNRKYGYTGHLFEGRYKSCIVKDDAYFLHSSRYIHLNPVKAGIVRRAEEYCWSSYRTLIAMKDDGITQVNRIWGYFQRNPPIRYREFVEDIGHKYQIQENRIEREIGDNNLLLPW